MLQVLIVPLWNWNYWYTLFDYHASCFNRTFMELKLLIYFIWLSRQFVLIVPLWNWNSRTPSTTWLVCKSFNRTFMELKSYKYAYGYYSTCFNRTFMELKLKPYERHDKIRTVLIVPLWNWNFCPKAVLIPACWF